MVPRGGIRSGYLFPDTYRRRRRQPNNATVETLDLYSAIEVGKQRRQAAKGANE